MNPFAEIGLIVGRELRRHLRSAKGIFLFALSVLGGTVTSLAAGQIDRLGDGNLGPEKLQAVREAMLAQKYGDAAIGKYLAEAPFVLPIMLGLTVWLGPLVVTLMGFDAISGDIQHRSVRFWTVRMRRASYYGGKFLGLWAAVSAVTLVMNLCVWGIMIGRGDATPGAALAWGMRFWAVSLPISAAWCGVATLVASMFDAPILSLLATLAAFFGLWIAYAVGTFRELPWLTYFYPNSYDAWLLSPNPSQVALGALACFAFAAVATGAGTVLFHVRDV